MTVTESRCSGPTGESQGVGLQLNNLSNNVGSTLSEFFFLKGGGCCSRSIGFIQFTLQPGTNTLQPGTNLLADPLSQIQTSSVVNIHGA